MVNIVIILATERSVYSIDSVSVYDVDCRLLQDEYNINVSFFSYRLSASQPVANSAVYFQSITKDLLILMVPVINLEKQQYTWKQRRYIILAKLITYWILTKILFILFSHSPLLPNEMATTTIQGFSLSIQKGIVKVPFLHCVYLLPTKMGQPSRHYEINVHIIPGLSISSVLLPPTWLESHASQQQWEKSFRSPRNLKSTSRSLI